MARLITGGSGQIGAELAHILVEQGEDIVIFDINKGKRFNDIEKKVKFVRGDVGVWPEVMNVVKDNRVSHIYHMGAMLTSESEANPWASFQVNVVGTYNILEAARLFGVQQVMFTSSIGTFGMTSESSLSDTTLQRPNTFYGSAKLYGEGLGRWYNRKFGLDFRGVRYPSVVGPGIATPGHWDAPMILSAIAGKTYQCSVPPQTPTAMLYYRDAALAADLLLKAPRESIKMMTYNIGGMPAATPKQTETEIKKYFPQASVTYPENQPVNLVVGRSWDDSFARKEWGWRPQYSTLEQIISDMVKEMREHRDLYG